MSSQNLISRHGDWTPFQHTARKKVKTTTKTDKKTKQLQFRTFKGSGNTQSTRYLRYPASVPPPPPPGVKSGNSLLSRPRGGRTASRRNVRRLQEIKLTSGHRRRRKKSALLKVPNISPRE